MEETAVPIQCITVPGSEINEQNLKGWCKLPNVYISHRWGHVSGKLVRGVKINGRYVYSVYIQGAEGSASITFTRDSIDEVVYVGALGPIPYYIKLKKG